MIEPGTLIVGISEESILDQFIFYEQQKYRDIMAMINYYCDYKGAFISHYCPSADSGVSTHATMSHDVSQPPKARV